MCHVSPFAKIALARSTYLSLSLPVCLARTRLFFVSLADETTVHTRAAGKGFWVGASIEWQLRRRRPKGRRPGNERNSLAAPARANNHLVGTRIQFASD